VNVDAAEYTVEQFDSAYAEFTARMREIHETKRNDYSAGHSPIHNYETTAQVMGTTPELVMLTRIQEKVIRAANLLGGVEQMVKDESIEDTLLDISNISALIAARRIAIRRRKGSPPVLVSEFQPRSMADVITEGTPE
jgi:hypothetical protein